MKFYKNTLLAGSLSAALVLGACSTASASDDMEWEDGGSEGTVEVKAEETSFSYSVQDAVDLAGERFEGMVTEVELDEDDGIHYYEIEMENGEDEYDIKINAEDLSIIEEETERNDDDESSKAVGTENMDHEDSGFIGMDEAVRIAKDETGGGEVYGKDFDRDDNEYEIELHHDGSEYDVEINATTGEVKKVDQENDTGGEYGNDSEAEGDFISSEEAARIAIDAAGGGTVKESELDKEDSEYDFEIDYDGREYEVEINAVTGEVLDVEQDD